MDDEGRMAVGIVGLVCISLVVIVLGSITYYDKVPWYASVLVAAIGYFSLPFMIWGDNITNIIDTTLSFFKKGKE
jgi:hypothetical protein